MKRFLVLLFLMTGMFLTLSAGDHKREIGAELEPAFLEYCLDMSSDGGRLDTDGDGLLTAGEAAAATRINVGFTNKKYTGKFSALKGLKYFTGLERLDCSFNKLTSLDLRAQKNLQQLTCYHNQLRTIDLSECAELSEMFCQNNLFESLDFSGCPKMMHIYAINNPELVWINVENSTFESLINLDVKGGCRGLETVYVNETFDIEALPKYWRFDNPTKLNFVKR